MNLRQCFDRLGLRSTATFPKVKNAYWSRIKNCVPPENFPAGSQDRKNFAKVKADIVAAYEQLHAHFDRLKTPEGKRTEPLPIEVRFKKCFRATKNKSAALKEMIEELQAVLPKSVRTTYSSVLEKYDELDRALDKVDFMAGIHFDKSDPKRKKKGRLPLEEKDFEIRI